MRCCYLWIAAIVAIGAHCQSTPQNGPTIDPSQIDLSAPATPFDPSKPISILNTPGPKDPILRSNTPLPGEDDAGNIWTTQAGARGLYVIHVTKGPVSRTLFPGSRVPNCGVWLHNTVLPNIDLFVEARPDGTYAVHALTPAQRAAGAAAGGMGLGVQWMAIRNVRPALRILAPLRFRRRRRAELLHTFCKMAGRHARWQLKRLRLAEGDANAAAALALGLTLGPMAGIPVAGAALTVLASGPLAIAQAAMARNERAREARAAQDRARAEQAAPGLGRVRKQRTHRPRERPSLARTESRLQLLGTDARGEAPAPRQEMGVGKTEGRVLGAKAGDQQGTSTQVPVGEPKGRGSVEAESSYNRKPEIERAD